MATILKRPESKFFICAYTAADGRQLKRSTKQVRRDPAMRLCLEWQAAEDQSRNGLLTEAQARRILAEIVERTTGEKMETVTTRQFFERWLHSKEMGKAVGTARRYRHSAESFLSQLGSRSNLNINSVRPGDVEDFRDSQIAAGKSSATANMAVKTLRVAFTVARRQGLLTTNPAEAIELMPTEGVSRKPFAPEQVRRLLEACAEDEEWKGLILVGRYTGLRLGDAVNLTARNLNEASDGCFLTVFPQKRQRAKKPTPHVIPVPIPVVDWIEGQKLRAAGNRPFFPTLQKVQLGGCNGLSARFQKIMARAGIAQEFEERETQGKGRRVHLLTFHSLRHTMNSRMANAEVNRELRMKFLGHTTDVHDRYTHHELSALRSAINQAGTD